jgi:Domain of unknown function (DUF4157)
MKKIKQLIASAGMLAASSSYACPDGQYSLCVVPNPFGGCIQSICVPVVPVPDPIKPVIEDPVKLLVNPTAIINQTGIPTQGDVFEFVVKSPEKVIELVGNPGNWPYVPVASAMIAARNAVVTGGGQPIPAHIKVMMRRWYSDDLINSVRWTANWNPLRNSLQAAQMNMNGNTQAIALINAVVFRDARGAQDPVLWAHELYHVEQYQKWGVFGFARTWVNNSSDTGPVEGPAYDREQAARQVFGATIIDDFDERSGTYSSRAPEAPTQQNHQGMGRSGRNAELPNDMPNRPSYGVQNGAPLRHCGCWGPASFLMPFPWAQCQSGSAVHVSCNTPCYAGGTAYLTQCR